MAPRPCWAEISLSQLKENLAIIRRHIGPERKVLAVVKADAYGHGAVPVSRALEEARVDALGVACVAEGIELRQAGIRAPIVVLTGFFPGEEKDLIAHDITPGITEVGQVERLEKAAGGKRTRIHVKIDTGMGRLGVPCSDIPRLLDWLATSPSLELEGLYTHFASSEDFTSPQTDEQVRCFEKAREQFAARGLRPPLIHMANTGAIVARPEAWGTMVRPGSMLYGYLSFFKFPAGRDRSAEFAAQLPVKPALTLKAQVYLIREYAANAPLGYGANFVTQRPSRIAVLPIGYGDGWRRGLSGRCRVLVRGQFAPTVGTIGMDLTLADVTDVPGAQPGDEVMLIGTNGKASILPTEPARALGTVASEVLSGLTKRVPRVYRD
ncbi:MAG: alanine racemase [Acidobacteria bacterium RIFCSPHIGHO2_12_FULL_67_30]|nr:MAG: alanine racemase [Acidobacteria bacterium RIFCSPHIGHO2_02_FULL_67_57]OFV85914.1 MAG: alanine racemase [Acidobacteria bacterium RIFCSPHIGHO2_01_FULL_67_28]OFV89555.1 MAG: alanine racemase [Acidobacteria bacterium RIFCSPHIGHO2_12_FULL_67_30]